MSVDGYVQVATDGSGKKIDNSELTREPTTPGSAGETVYRQRVVIGDDENPRLQAALSGEAGRAAVPVDNETLEKILLELTRIRDILEVSIGG